MPKNLWNIYITFFKIGTILLGGGYVILPLLRSEIAEKKHWITQEELIEYFTLSQSLPGIIAANVSIFTGYKLLGMRGAVAALCGIISPAFFAIILIANLITEIAQFKEITHIFAGVGVGVTILIVLTVKDIWKKSVVDRFCLFIFILAFTLSYLKINPVFTIILCTIAGIMYKFKTGEHES